MGIKIEPLDGDELDRLITVLLNLTGLVGNIVEDAVAQAGGGFMDHAARRVRAALVDVPQRYGDAELRLAVEILAVATLAVAEDVEGGVVLRAPPRPRRRPPRRRSH